MVTWKRTGEGMFFAALLGLSGQAGAVVDTALYLTLDGSGSVDATEFDQQRDAYVTALMNVLTPGTGVAIGGAVFGGNNTQNEFFALTEIGNATDKQNLIDAFNALDETNSDAARGVTTGSTAIGDAVAAAATALLDEFLECQTITCIIDVSTDGSNNSGADPTAAVNQAITDGISAVNCIGIGAGADCTFVGANGFQISVDNFADFEEGIEQKIGRELGVPEPSSVLLLAIGLVALGLAASRRRGSSKGIGGNARTAIAA